MTERQREDDYLLNELLRQEQDNGAHVEQPAPGLTRGDELRLLEAAHAAGTPTLAPVDDTLTLEDTPAPGQMGGSFAGDLAGLVRRYPLAAAGVALGAALLLARRRR